MINAIGPFDKLLPDQLLTRGPQHRQRDLHNDPRPEFSSMGHKLVGQPVVLPEGRVQTDDQVAPSRKLYSTAEDGQKCI